MIKTQQKIHRISPCPTNLYASNFAITNTPTHHTKTSGQSNITHMIQDQISVTFSNTMAVYDRFVGFFNLTLQNVMCSTMSIFNT